MSGTEVIVVPSGDESSSSDATAVAAGAALATAEHATETAEEAAETAEEAAEIAAAAQQTAWATRDELDQLRMLVEASRADASLAVDVALDAVEQVAESEEPVDELTPEDLAEEDKPKPKGDPKPKRKWGADSWFGDR